MKVEKFKVLLYLKKSAVQLQAVMHSRIVESP